MWVCTFIQSGHRHTKRAYTHNWAGLHTQCGFTHLHRVGLHTTDLHTQCGITHLHKVGLHTQSRPTHSNEISHKVGSHISTKWAYTDRVGIHIYTKWAYMHTKLAYVQNRSTNTKWTNTQMASHTQSRFTCLHKVDLHTQSGHTHRNVISHTKHIYTFT